MKHQDQRLIKAVKSQMAECSEERQDKSRATQPYRAPQVSLVGKAKRLMAGYYYGDCYDWDGWYYWCY